jgi:P4 family phage/plasmid primase-like protien
LYQIFYNSPYYKVNKHGKKVLTNAYKPADVRPFETLEELFTKGAEELKASGGEGSDLVNIYYTLAYHERGYRSREAWKMQEYIPFDLDGIDQDKIDAYPPVACKALGLTLDDASIIHSGNGLQILFKVEQLTNPDFIFTNKNNWLRAYEKIEKACKEANLPLTRDTTAWDYARLFRLPNTINHKKKKNDKGELVDVIKHCKLVKLSSNIVPLPFDYAGGEDIPNTSMPTGSFGVPDAETIVNGCDFFKWLKAEPHEAHEPHAYAMLSITAHFEDASIGKSYYDRFNSPSINNKTYEEFSEQASKASGPRTCEGINNIWGKCASCPNYKKVTSPIQLKSASHIGTAGMGFTVKAGKTLIRDYRGLALFMSGELNFKSCSAQGVIYIFNGTHYQIYNDLSIKAYAEKHFSQPVKEKERQEFLAHVRVTNIIANDDEDNFANGSNTAGFINFKNGVLNLETGALYPHGPNFHFHYCLPYEYNPTATAPNWLRFLDQITMGREELKNILHEYMGFILYGGEYVYQKALILSGSGKNGKSTFINVLKELSGRGNFATVPLTTLATNNFFLPEIQNKLVNISEEEPPTCFKETGIFKNLTGNNSVSANRKFERPYSFVSKAKIVITYNEMPYISDTSTGMKRRLLIVPFDFNLEDSPELVDVKIMEKLRGELSGIFNLALEGYHRLEERGAFTKAHAVEEAIVETFDFNTFDLWYEENINKSDDFSTFTPCKEAYESYVEYVKGLAEGKQHYGLKKFGNEMKKKGFKSSVINKGGNSFRIYKGLKLAKTSNVSAKF